MPVILGFASFLFYRVFSAIAFFEPMTVLSCFLAGVLTAVIGFIFTLSVGFGAANFVATNSESSILSSILRATALPLLVAVAVNGLQGYLIIIGFSDSFLRQIRWNAYGDFFEQDLIWFLIMMAIPILVHSVTLIFLLNKASKINNDGE